MLLGIGIVLVLVSGGIVLRSIRGNKRRAREEETEHRSRNLSRLRPRIEDRVGLRGARWSGGSARLFSDGNGTATHSALVSAGNGSARPAVANGSTGNVGVDPTFLHRVRGSDAVEQERLASAETPFALASSELM